jgi:hypothetical protein
MIRKRVKRFSETIMPNQSLNRTHGARPFVPVD